VFWTLWWGTLVNRLANFVATFLALYLVKENGFDAAAAGRVVALYGAGNTLASPIGGVLADRVGRRATMLASLLLGALSVGALAFVRTPALLTTLAFIAGLTGQVYHPAVGAAVADVVPPVDRPRAYGLIYWAINLGMGLGFVIAGLVASRSLVALFLADAGTTLVCAALFAAKVRETRPAGLAHHPALAGLLRVFSDRPFAIFLLLQLAALVVFTQWQLALPLDMAAHGVGPDAFALLMALNCMGVVFLQPWLAPGLRRFERTRLLALSTLLFALGFGLNGMATGVPLYALGVVLWTVGEVVGFPVASALVADFAPPALRGRYQGAYSMTWGLAYMLSPLLGGETMAHWGAPALWALCLALGSAAAVGHLLAAGSRRRRLAGTPTGHQGALERAP
jgi:MFS family permease